MRMIIIGGPCHINDCKPLGLNQFSKIQQISPQLMQNLTGDRSQTQTHTCAIHEGNGGLTPDQHIYHDHSPAPSLQCFRAKHLTQNALGRLAVSAITAQTQAHPCDGKHTCMASTLQKRNATEERL